MRIALLGDIALFGKMSVNDNPNAAEYFSGIADYLKGFDYVVGNLETPFSVRKKTYGAKSAYICSDVENVKTLKQLHLDAVCLANNHMFDFGEEGYETTKKILTESGIKYFGTEGKEVHAEILGNKIAFSGFCCYTSNPLKCVPYGEYGVNAYSIPSALQVLKDNTSNGYLNIMAVHAGIEHVNYPSYEHVRAARLLTDMVPFVYYGHHPHVVQGVENYMGSIIAHSLGNFCFDDVYIDNTNVPLVALTENNRMGMILELTINNNKVNSWRQQLINITKDGPILLVKESPAVCKYNNILACYEENKDEIIELRKKIISERITDRKSRRDFRWYIRRIRLRYFRIILNSKLNRKKFNNNIIKYI